MLFRILVLSLFITVVYTADCNYQCAPPGGSCKPPTNNEPYYFCPPTQYCNQTNSGGTCTDLIATGSPCHSGDQCVANAICVSGTCVAKRVVEDGASCDSANLCGVNSECSGGVCSAAPTRGASCTNKCQGDNTCNKGVCVELYSVANNGACDHQDACVAGSYCSRSSGTCQPGKNSSGAICTFSDELTVCAADESCQCVTYGVDAGRTCKAPSPPNAALATAIAAERRCVSTHQCSALDQPGSGCSVCNGQFCARIRAVEDSGEYAHTPTCLIPATYINTTWCSGVTTTTTTSTASSLSTVLLYSVSAVAVIVAL